METKTEGRLFSLDALRGLDMLLLTVVTPLAFAIDEGYGLPTAVMYQFNHPWGGFSLLDIIMPLFIFMCGAAVPLGLRRRLDDGKQGWRYWRHVLGRVALLWVLGMVAQGRLLSLDPLKISPFDNTLQAIACGYVVSAAVWRLKPDWLRRSIPVALALGYAAILHWGGDYSQTGNAAIRFEHWFVALIVPAGSQVLALADPLYSWWLTIPMFAVMSLCGTEATLVLKGEASPWRKAANLAATGAVLLAVGWLIVPVIPPIKQIFTLSFTAQAMGWCFLALAGLYALTDIWRLRRGWWLVTLFGQTALLAYMCTEVFGATFLTFGTQLAPGVELWFGKGSFFVGRWLGATALLVTVLVVRRRLRTCGRAAEGRNR